MNNNMNEMFYMENMNDYNKMNKNITNKQVSTDYYNYDNNNYNQPNYNQTFNMNKLFDAYQGFIRGNMYSDLYNPYRNDRPYEIMPNNEQAELLTYVDVLDFAASDLSLYLDIYPNDKQAMQLYNHYLAQLKDYKKSYESKYGPLSMHYDSSKDHSWKWIESPWPWEGGK